jgi:hypothetical protein
LHQEAVESLRLLIKENKLDMTYPCVCSGTIYYGVGVKNLVTDGECINKRTSL